MLLSSQFPLTIGQMNGPGEFLFNINTCSLLADIALYYQPYRLLPLNYPVHPQLSP